MCIKFLILALRDDGLNLCGKKTVRHVRRSEQDDMARIPCAPLPLLPKAGCNPAWPFEQGIRVAPTQGSSLAGSLLCAQFTLAASNEAIRHVGVGYGARMAGSGLVGGG